jgi:methionine aminopeptidase
MSQELTQIADYTLANPDTITKYKVAADISQKVLKEVSGTLPHVPAPTFATTRGPKLTLYRMDRR